MKKTFILSFALVCMLCSCSSSSDYVEEPIANNAVVDESNSLSSVQAQIEALNQEMFTTTTSSVQPRKSLRSFFRKFFAVVICDAAGGLVGSLAGPAGAAAGAMLSSGLAAVTSPENIQYPMAKVASANTSAFASMNSEAIALSKGIVPVDSTSQKASLNDSIGYYHNQLMLKMGNELVYSDSINKQIADNVITLTASNYSVPLKEVSSYVESNKTFFDNITNKGLCSTDDVQSIEGIIKKWIALYPEYSSQFEVLQSFIEGVSNLDVDVNDGTYLNKVLGIINTSTLSDTMKQSLRNAFIVGNASYQLWNTGE